MDGRTLSEVLADNLKRAMRDADGGAGITAAELARRSGVPQRTVSLYLRPSDRSDTSGGVPPSPTIERVALLGNALNWNAWELLHPDPDQARRERALYLSVVDKLSPPVTSNLPIRRVK